MKYFRLICVSCLFIVPVLSTYICAFEASVHHISDTDADPKHKGHAYLFKCPLSCFGNTVWNRYDLITTGKHEDKKYVICCIKKDNHAIYVTRNNKSTNNFILKSNDDERFNDLNLSKIKFVGAANNIPSRHKRLLNTVVKLQLYQTTFTELTPKALEFLRIAITRLASYAERNLPMVIHHLTNIVRTNFDNIVHINFDDSTDELIDVILLLDNRLPMQTIYPMEKSKAKCLYFPCLDNQCNFFDNTWHNVYKHMRKQHCDQFPSKRLSVNKFNYENRKQGCKCVAYVPCQANLAKDIQSYAYYLASNGYAANYENLMEYYIKPTYNADTFDKLGYGSIKTFCDRHQIYLHQKSERKSKTK